MFRHKKIYQPNTLRGLCINTIKHVYKNHWHETKVLPKCLQDELLVSWLRCDERVPETDEDLEGVRKLVVNGWRRMPDRPMTSAIFLALMRLPDEIPPFAYPRNHAIFNYFVWNNGFKDRNLCDTCYARISQFYQPYSANLWLEKGWKFAHVTDHRVYEAEELLPALIWLRDNWCENCYIEPLWDKIIDDDDCLYTYDYHVKRRRRWSNSSSDSDSDIETCKIHNMLGRRMCPEMYKTLNKKYM